MSEMVNREKLVLEELYGSVIESIVLDYKYLLFNTMKSNASPAANSPNVRL